MLLGTKEEGHCDLRFQVMPLGNVFYRKQQRHGHKENFKFFLGNFQGQVIYTKEFLLQDYITSNKLTKTLLFLLSKLKIKLELINDMIQDDLDFADDLDDILPSVSNITFSSAT